MLTLLFRFPGISTHLPHVRLFALVIFLALDKRLIVDPRETYVRCAEGHVPEHRRQTPDVTVCSDPVDVGKGCLLKGSVESLTLRLKKKLPLQIFVRAVDPRLAACSKNFFE